MAYSFKTNRTQDLIAHSGVMKIKAKQDLQFQHFGLEEKRLLEC